MGLRIGLFACELLYPDHPPHLGMCLFIEDLRRAGFECRPFLVNLQYADRIPLIAREEGLDLAALEAVFPLPVVRRLSRGLEGIPLLLGGVNALSLFLRSPAAYAVVGPGREAMLGLALALDGRGRLEEVPNLFYRSAAGVIEHTGVYRDWDLRQEILPFRPVYDWDYVGPQRSPGAALNMPSVVPEFGCPWCRPLAGNPHYASLPPAPVPQGPGISPRAAEAMRRHLAASDAGCSFCVFRSQDHARLPVAETVDLLLLQTRHLREVHGAEEIFIQSENPFPYLLPFLEAAGRAGLQPRRLHIRTMPLLLVRHRRTVERCLERLRPTASQLCIKQLGFESFVQRHLDIFNKGARVEDNLAACRLLRDLHQRHGEVAVEGFYGHGLILFHPWSSLEELEENLTIIEREAPFLRTATALSSRLMLYNEFSPIFRKALAEGLLRQVQGGVGWDFRFQDRRMELVAPLTGRVIGALAQRLEAEGGADGARLRWIAARSQFEALRAAVACLAARGEAAAEALSGPLPPELARVVEALDARWRGIEVPLSGPPAGEAPPPL